SVEIEAAQISTIHALAARICREHPAHAEVAPDFAILDDLEGVIWRAEHLEEALAALPTSVLDAVDLGTLRFVLDALLNEPLTAEIALTRGPQVWRALLERERSQALAAVLDVAEWAAGRRVLSSFSGSADDKGEIARLACLRAMEAFEGGEFAAALEHVNAFRTNAGQKGNWPGGGLEDVRGAFKAIKGLIKDACEKDGRVLLAWGGADDALASLLPQLAAAYAAVSAQLESARRRERKLDFTALEVHALRALAVPEVVDYYARRW